MSDSCFRHCLPCVLLLTTTAVFAASKPEWIGLQTEQFRAISQVKERKAREIVRELQVFHAALGSMVTVSNKAPSVPMTVFLLARDDFARATRGMGEVAGVFIRQPFQNDIVIDASLPTRQSLSAVYHEYVHFQLRNNGHMQLPAFYEEALAELVQSFWIDGRVLHYAYFPEGLRREGRSAAMPLSRVIGVDVGSDDYVSHRFQGPFYARSLLLQHFCTVGNPGCRAPLMQFATRIVNGEAPQAAFVAEFKVTPDEFDKVLDKYLVDRAWQLHASTSLDAVPKAKDPLGFALSREEADLAYANLLLRVSRDLDGIDGRVSPTLALQPDHPGATATLALWNARAGRNEEALALVTKIGDAQDTDAQALTVAGQVLIDQARLAAATATNAAESNITNHANRARELFKRALVLDAGRFDAAFGYAESQLFARGNLQESEQIVADAVKRFPESGELLLMYAVHLGMRGAEADARILMARAGCRVINPELRALVRQQIGELTCTKAR
jgi:hypothetical protein